MTKPRIRYTSKGWFRYWLTMATGTKDLRTGIRFPDRWGCFEQEFWVGPFETIEKAFSVNLITTTNGDG